MADDSVVAMGLDHCKDQHTHDHQSYRNDHDGNICNHDSDVDDMDLHDTLDVRSRVYGMGCQQCEDHTNHALMGSNQQLMC